MAGCRTASSSRNGRKAIVHMTPSAAGPAALVAASALTKVFPRGREKVRALDEVSFQIRQREFVAITGPSGAGKTTLLNLLGCMDVPTAGVLRVAGQEVQSFSEADRTRFRREQVGFVFQHFGLLPTLTVAENIALPALFARRDVRQFVGQLLAKVGLSDRQDHRPAELSGGEMQRVAIARALVNGPALLLADEPTGNLDSVTGDAIIALFRELNADGLTLVVVTHNAAMTHAAGRVLSLQDGRLTQPVAS
jgi:putative ABC transport system ATP-binding protein